MGFNEQPGVLSTLVAYCGTTLDPLTLAIFPVKVRDEFHETNLKTKFRAVNINVSMQLLMCTCV